MTQTDDRIRELMNELAEQVRPVPFLVRLDHQAVPRPRRRRFVAAAAAVSIAAALAVVAVTGHYPRTAEPLPSDRPSRIFELTDKTSARPGLAVLAVTLPGSGAKPLYLQTATGAVVRLRPPDGAAGVWTQHLSADGTRLVRQRDDDLATRAPLEVVNLLTGRSDDLGGAEGACPRLSPDNQTVAMYTDRVVRLVDIRARTSLTIRTVFSHGVDDPTVYCGAMGWSPDSARLAIRGSKTSVVVDTRGHVLFSLGRSYVTNGSQSWSPDGRSILTYDPLRGTFAIQAADGSGAVQLPRPAGATMALGWAGQRVVWMVGEQGSQRLVTTDRDGRNGRTWMRFDIGDQIVETVTWSRALSG